MIEGPYVDWTTRLALAESLLTRSTREVGAGLERRSYHLSWLRRTSASSMRTDMRRSYDRDILEGVVAAAGEG